MLNRSTPSVIYIGATDDDESRNYLARDILNDI